MSRAEKIEVQCPQCGHQQEMTRWYSVNASMSPQAKAAMLSGQHHVFRCGTCSAQARLEVEFMYHDMERRFCLMYFPPASLDDQKFFERFTSDAGLKLRAVPEISEVEYIRHPHIVFDLDEMRRYIRFRDGLAESHEGQEQPAGGMGTENP